MEEGSVKMSHISSLFLGDQTRGGLSGESHQYTSPSNLEPAAHISYQQAVEF